MWNDLYGTLCIFHRINIICFQRCCSFLCTAEPPCIFVIHKRSPLQKKQKKKTAQTRRHFHVTLAKHWREALETKLAASVPRIRNRLGLAHLSCCHLLAAFPSTTFMQMKLYFYLHIFCPDFHISPEAEHTLASCFPPRVAKTRIRSEVQSDDCVETLRARFGCYSVCAFS